MISPSRKTIKKAKAKKLTQKKKGILYYTCQWCLKVSTKLADVCSPVKTNKFYTCETCGKSGVNSKHLCVPMISKIKYMCSTCGKASPFRARVCEPKTV